MRYLELERRKTRESQRAFGRRSGVDASYVCVAERYGFARPVHLQRFADALGWPGDPASLLDELPASVQEQED